MSAEGLPGDDGVRAELLSGGRVLSLSHPMQRHLRNALAARQHLAVTEEHYETAGRERIQSAKSCRD